MRRRWRSLCFKWFLFFSGIFLCLMDAENVEKIFLFIFKPFFFTFNIIIVVAVVSLLHLHAQRCYFLLLQFSTSFLCLFFYIIRHANNNDLTLHYVFMPTYLLHLLSWTLEFLSKPKPSSSPSSCLTDTNFFCWMSSFSNELT